MFTQVELTSDKVVRVYWLQHKHNDQPIRVGRGIRILEETPYFCISRVFVTLKDRADLPVKVNVGTIVELN